MNRSVELKRTPQIEEFRFEGMKKKYSLRKFIHHFSQPVYQHFNSLIYLKPIHYTIATMQSGLLTVAVIGGGFLGTKIAAEFAMSGGAVVRIYDSNIRPDQLKLFVR